MNKQTHCPICKNELVKIFSTKDYLISGETFDIVECSSCTLRITNPFPSVDTIGNYYNSEDYISHSDETKGLFEFIYKFVRSYMLDKKESSRFLEIVQNLKNLKSGQLYKLNIKVKKAKIKKNFKKGIF